MSNLHLNRDRQNLGQFSPQEVADGLADGRFLPTDLAWREGMDTWRPLATITDLPPAEHAAAEATVAPDSEQPAASPPALVPEWERQMEIGYVPALLRTIAQVFGNPTKTFREMSKTGGVQRPLAYCFILAFVGSMCSILAAQAWALVLPARVLMKGYGETAEVSPLFQIAVSVPIIVAASLAVPFVMSGIYYLVIKLITKREATFELVFRTYCYAAGTLALLKMLPIPPVWVVLIPLTLLAAIIAVTYQVVAIRESVGMTTLEAVAVILLPLLLLCGCCVAALGGFMALAGAPALQNL